MLDPLRRPKNRSAYEAETPSVGVLSGREPTT